MIRVVKIVPDYGESFYAAQQPRFLQSPLYLCTQEEVDADIVKFPDPGSLIQELTDNYIRCPKDWIPLNLQNHGYRADLSVVFALKTA